MGHEAIIERGAFERGLGALILVRDTSEKMSATKAAQLIRKRYAGRQDVRVQVVPDVHAVCYGRGVGYSVDCIEVPEDLKAVSATAVRAGSLGHVHESIREDVREALS